jgi:hypothetical protein
LSWAPPQEGQQCPLKLPRCFSSQDLEKHDNTIIWTAPNETALAHVYLRLRQIREDSGIPFTTYYDGPNMTIGTKRG